MYVVAGRLDPDSYFELAPGDVPRDGRRRDHRASASSTTSTTSRTGRRTPTPTPWGTRCSRRPARRASGSRCSTRSTSPAASASRRRACRRATATAAPRPGTTGWRRSTPARAPASAAALHSVRAVPRGRARARRAQPTTDVLHVHLSEQVAENEACQAGVRRDPDAAARRPRAAAADHHAGARHPPDARPTSRSSGRRDAYVDFCPTTERDLGDGVGPSRRLADAGARLTLGSDSHAVIDLFEEMRAVELDERLATMRRGHWSAAELLTAATTTGHASLGWADAGLDRRRPARRPGHPRPGLAAHRRRGHRRARGGLRRERRRRRPGGRRRPSWCTPATRWARSVATSTG